MSSYRRRAAEALGITGGTGSWGRRIATQATVIDGVTLGALGTKGSWERRLAEAMGRTAGIGSWLNRITLGAGSEEAFALTCEGALPPPPEGFAYVVQGSDYVTHSGAYVITGIV